MQGDREKCIAAGMDDYLAKPVRVEDLRAIVERWGATAGTTEPPQTSASVSESSSSSGSSAAALEASSGKPDAPVDMERLLDFTNGDPANLRELATLYLEQTTAQLDQIEAAIRKGETQEVRRVAHSCAGASATCGVRRLVPILRELERQGLEGNLTNADELCRQAVAEFGCIRHFLEAYLAAHADLAAQT
jgi:HPt (histidine-containing phosphotransfer) domain-containing protein